MREVRFRYRCRRCGKIDASTGTNLENAYAMLMQGIAGLEPTVPLISAHPCPSGGMGVTDLIGFCEVESEPCPKS